MTATEHPVEHHDPIDVRPETTPRRRGGRRAAIAVAVVLAALGFVLWKGLGEATVYFKTADEAVAEKDALGGRRFRVEGLVTDPVEHRDGAVFFAITSAGVCVDVRHTGDPPELFKPGIPVVLEGQWRGDTYVSDTMMVRHSSEYRAENEGRLEDAANEQYASCQQ
ncbi:MAG TPA: cytochrome c maturation protein CcmE [Acidimicrobiales bacterium]